MWSELSRHYLHCMQSEKHHMVVRNEYGNQKGSICHLADSFRWKNGCLKFERRYPEIEGTDLPIEMQRSFSGSRDETEGSTKSRTSLNWLIQDETFVSEGGHSKDDSGEKHLPMPGRPVTTTPPFLISRSFPSCAWRYLKANSYSSRIRRTGSSYERFRSRRESISSFGKYLKLVPGTGCSSSSRPPLHQNLWYTR